MSSPPPFLTLPPRDRDALALLALSPRPLPRADWEQRVRAAGLQPGEAFRQLVARLEGTSIVGNEKGFFVRRDEVAPVLDDARARGRLDALTNGAFPREKFYWVEAEERLRIAIALHDARLLATELQRMSWVSLRRGELSPLVRALTLAAPESWLAQLPADVKETFLRDALHAATLRLAVLGTEVMAAVTTSLDGETRARAAILHALAGKGDAARALIPETGGGPWEVGARGVIALTEARWEDALTAFDEAGTTKQGSRRARGLPSYLAVFDLLLAGSPVGRAAEASTLPARVEGARATLAEWPAISYALSALVAFRTTGRVEEMFPPQPHASWLEVLVYALACAWVGARARPLDAAFVRPARAGAEAGGYAWVARQLQSIVEEGEPDPGLLSALRSRNAAWELALEALSGAVSANKSRAAAGPTGEGEILWVVEDVRTNFDALRLSARWAKKRGQGGTGVSIERLQSDTSLPLTAEDRPLAEALVAAKRLRAGVLPLRTLLLAIGHPRLRDASGAPITVERGAPEVRVRATASGARLESFPSRYEPSGVAVVMERGRILVFERTATAARLTTILGDEGIQIPAEGLARAAETLAALGAHVAVRGAEVLGHVAGARDEAADPRIHVRVSRAGASFRVRLRIVPGGSEGPALRPGSEPAHVLVAGSAGPRALRRDLAEERASLARLLEACPLLGALQVEGDDRIAADVETCLEVLLELDPLRDRGEIVIEWPNGEPLRPPLQRDARSLRVRVATDADWLSVEADFEVDEGRVIAFSELIDQLSSARGRFVPLANGEYVALTEKLRERIDALARVHALRDKRGRTALAMLPALANWAEGTDLAIATELRGRLDALSRALETSPRVPRTVQAELRDYQRDGFAFLARRAAGGVGACLADDMGLGKTVQALALLAMRAKAGPAVVFAPTSVCRNWEEEARKFVPSLTFQLLAGAADRAACVAQLGPGDVLLASYGLLASCPEILSSRRFATAIFDEAHALKNPETRRATAARAVAADAVVALTGTPLENHLGELHALFDLVSPGLLGSRDKFEKAFAAPIARSDKSATAHLRALVRPFLLRRTKAQVLDELPEKTEITRVIAPSDAERSFYEALRRGAAARVDGAEKEKGAQARIRILAEITKLRRAAIDPRLVAGDDAPPGSKLDALAELVAELREEGHRALVFSQFLEVLDRAGERLAADGARCARLDGGMDIATRAAAVDAFQSGQADVFLLSLRAGGVGMNLTAADYVIHLDPWWNPAVEDQATDRAHRIGQTRPVTVVRLVTEGTIEEKVLRLHAAKRALYADALGGLDVAKKLDLAALADLLREPMEAVDRRAPE